MLEYGSQVSLLRKFEKAVGVSEERIWVPDGRAKLSGAIFSETLLVGQVKKPQRAPNSKNKKNDLD